MDIARVNGSQGSPREIQTILNILGENLPKNIGILLDLPGNKIRTTNIKESIEVKRGERFVLHSDILTYKDLYTKLKNGDLIFTNNGSPRLKVTDISGGGDIICEVITDGVISNNKGILVSVNFEHHPFIFERDSELINLAISHKIDYLGLSFVRNTENVRRVRAILKGTDIKIVAKIETKDALNDLDGILKFADLVMIDRGDLGREIGYENLAVVQKRLLKKCVDSNIPAIVATEFLSSMTNNSSPLISEISDISNAVMDGASYLMLSEETAAGRYPVESLQMMDNIITNVETQTLQDLKVIILAAGESAGFGSLTLNKHKCLLDIGGITIIEHQLDNIGKCGIPSNNVLIATGSNFEKIEEYINCGKQFQGNFTYNPWYLTTNMLTTLWLARSKLAGGFVLIYGDIVFDWTILKDLFICENDMVAVVDSKHTVDEEDEKVCVDSGMLTRAGKYIDLKDADGEFIGMAKFSKEGAKRLFDQIDEMIRKNNLTAFICQAFEGLISKNEKICVLYTDGRLWSDNDCLPDLQKTRGIIYPGIIKKQKESILVS